MRCHSSTRSSAAGASTPVSQRSRADSASSRASQAKPSGPSTRPAGRPFAAVPRPTSRCSWPSSASAEQAVLRCARGGRAQHGDHAGRQLDAGHEPGREPDLAQEVDELAQLPAGRRVVAGLLVQLEDGEGGVQPDPALAVPEATQLRGVARDRAVAARGTDHHVHGAEQRLGQPGRLLAGGVEDAPRAVPVAAGVAQQPAHRARVQAEGLPRPSGARGQRDDLVEVLLGPGQVADLVVQAGRG